jgi:hypothetical protein
MVRELDGTWLENWWEWVWERQHSLNWKMLWICLCPMQMLTKGCPHERGLLTTKWIQWPLWMASQPLSLAIPVTAQWIHEQTGQDVRDGGYTWAQQHGLWLTRLKKQAWLYSFLSSFFLGGWLLTIYHLLNLRLQLLILCNSFLTWKWWQ